MFFKSFDSRNSLSERQTSYYDCCLHNERLYVCMNVYILETITARTTKSRP